jgi:hypothetical protein
MPHNHRDPKEFDRLGGRFNDVRSKALALVGSSGELLVDQHSPNTPKRGYPAPRCYG